MATPEPSTTTPAARPNGQAAPREPGIARLEEAIAAYQEALKEYTRQQTPLDWAAAQHNLGNALLTLGARETGPERLEQAVAAYRAAPSSAPGKKCRLIGLPHSTALARR